ncbi:hypothetical protein K2X89_15860 [Myxococcota bacterium]|nr:hypothetical protein [Myxococcota bacterium]
MEKIGLLIAGSYVAFVTYRVLILAVFGAFFVAGLLLRSFFGLEGEPFLPIAGLLQRLGDNVVAVGIAAVASVASVLWIGSGSIDRALARIPGLVVALTLSAVVGITVVVDARYGISPVAARLPSPLAEGHDLSPEAMTLEEIVYFTGVKPRVETVGILTYRDAARRFVLEDPAGSLPPVALDLYERRKLFVTSFVEMRSLSGETEARPELYALVEPFVGRRVRVTGSASNGAVRAHVSDLRSATASQEAPPPAASRAVVPPPDPGDPS